MQVTNDIDRYVQCKKCLRSETNIWNEFVLSDIYLSTSAILIIQSSRFWEAHALYIALSTNSLRYCTLLLLSNNAQGR